MLINNYINYFSIAIWIETLLPERTSRVLQPAFWPNNISVSNLSPTIHILEQLILNLQTKRQWVGNVLFMIAKIHNKGMYMTWSLKTNVDLYSLRTIICRHAIQVFIFYMGYHCLFWQLHNVEFTHLKFQTMIYSLGILFFQKLCTKVNNSYFFNKNSIRKLDGFPTTIGSFWVDPQIAATIHPAPETQQGKYYKAKF